MLKELLESKKCFKLVCAAGNEDTAEVEKLVALYSSLDCRFFDLCANPDVIIAAQNALKRVGKKAFLCASVGTKGDPHTRKAQINSKCSKCARCIKTCPQDAISNEFLVNQIKCIGCGKCLDACAFEAIEFIDKNCNLQEILPVLTNLKVDCIELHGKITDNSSTEEILEKWEFLNENFKGFLSICINSKEAQREKLVELLKTMVSMRKPFTTIVKSEGDSMTGCVRDFETTMETIKVAELINKENLPIYIMLSGGTNIKSAQIAKEMNVPINGVAVGTYARNLVKEFTIRDDFFANSSVFEGALKKADELIQASLQYL